MQADQSAREAALRGTPLERRRYIDALRARARDREKQRRRLAQQPPHGGRYAIDRSAGFRTVPPGELAGAQPVIEDARVRAGNLAADPPASGKAHLTTGLLSPDSLTLSSSFMRLALDEEIIASVSSYLGTVPVLNTVDVWHSRPVKAAPQSSQLFHLDYVDATQIKLFVHCTDVGHDSGPLSVLDVGRSEQLVERSEYHLKDRLTDERASELLGDAAIPIRLTGPTGTAHFVDTSRCFHFGSRVDEKSPPRTVAVIQYLTPYAFAFQGDPHEEAPYRRLAGGGLSERQRLVLGAER